LEQSDTVHEQKARQSPDQNPPVKRKMDLGIILIWFLAGVLVTIALFRGSDSLSAGFQGSWQALRDLFPLLLGVFIIIGFADALLPKELIAGLLGGESGVRGIFIASGLGVLTPGGPFVSYPLVATLYKSGAGIGPLVAFVTAWALGSISRLPLEIGLVGLRLTAIRLASSLVFPPLAGFIATAIVNFLRP
jgi:uncharacterized membrane protein YraQ (UPF0718 family)